MEVQKKVVGKAENPEINVLEVSEKVAGDAQSPEPQIKSRNCVEEFIEKEFNKEAGLPEVVENEVDRSSGSHEATLETMETRVNLDFLDVKETVSAPGEKRSNEGQEDSTSEPVLKCPRLEASSGDPNCDTEKDAEIPKKLSGMEKMETKNLPESDDVTERKSWDPELIRQLIAAVKERPALYDSRSYFGNVFDWCAIADKLKRSKEDCRFMFASLREKFKIAHMAISDPQSVKNSQNDFPYYDEMHFLKPFIGNILSSQSAKTNYKWPTLNYPTAQTPIPIDWNLIT